MRRKEVEEAFLKVLRRAKKPLTAKEHVIRMKKILYVSTFEWRDMLWNLVGQHKAELDAELKLSLA